MKEHSHASIVCGPYCRFYKPGKEEMACAGLLFFQKRWSEEQLRGLCAKLSPMAWNGSEDESLSATLCRLCEFRIDGCGFREGEADSPPCGGYILLELLLRQGLLQPDDL